MHAQAGALLVDVSRIPELCGVSTGHDARTSPAGAEAIRIGAATTHEHIARDRTLQRDAGLLTLASAAVGSLQIRNLGTLGGNLGNGSPAADTVPALLCLDAIVELASARGSRSVPIESFCVGPGKTDCQSDELIVAVWLPKPLRALRANAAVFKKAGQRRGMCCSKATVAVTGRMTEGSAEPALHDVRIAMGAVAPTAISVQQAAARLNGSPLTDATIAEVAELCRQHARPITDLRSTEGYRRQVVGALLTEGLLQLRQAIWPSG
jgi:CO/xanthine dehydrogenase FAD-binding subunit